MRQPRASVLIATAIAAAVSTLALSGCGGGTPPTTTPTTSPSSSAPTTPVTTPSATPTPTGPAALPADALFSISATVTTKTGAAADLYQVVYKPTPVDPADTALLDKQCNFTGSPKWQTEYKGNVVYVASTLTATLHPGSPAFKKIDAVNFDLGWGSSAYSGDYAPFEASCAAGYIVIPGTIHGVLAVSSTDPAHGKYGWATSSSAYGFFGGGNDPGPDASGTAVVANCVVQLSPEASAASADIVAWATKAYTKQDACDFEIK